MRQRATPCDRSLAFARLAGVGIGTASRVVSGNGSVAPATLEKGQEGDAGIPDRCDTDSSRFTVPRLSSVDIPWNDLTESGSNLLLNRCYRLDRPVRRQFPVSVTTRDSLVKAPSPR